jgi:hypothetical protein
MRIDEQWSNESALISKRRWSLNSLSESQSRSVRATRMINDIWTRLQSFI